MRDETIEIRELPKWWSRRPFRWQVWGEEPYENKWGDQRHRECIVAHGRTRTRAEAEVRALAASSNGDLAVVELVEAGIEAFRLTREYVGEAMLPEGDGWEWFKWTERASEFLREVS